MKFSVPVSRMGSILHPLAFRRVAETQHDSVSVDAPEDVARVVQLLSKSRSA